MNMHAIGYPMAMPSLDQNPVYAFFSDTGGRNNLQESSQTPLVLLTSLAFLVPAVSCWRMARLWHAWIFGMMTVICYSFNFCSAAEAERVGMCSVATTHWLLCAYRVWMCFCFLQIAFLVFGPEDRLLQQLADKPAWKSSPALATDRVPWDVIVTTRTIPILVLLVFNTPWFVSDMDYWQNMLLTEILLIACSGAFWLHRNRRKYAAEVLLRFKFWHRLLHHGLIPTMMLFWVFCIMSFTDQKGMHAILNIVIAAFAVSILRAVHAEGFSSTVEVLDVSAQNPTVAHVLMGSVALVLIPTTVVAASYNFCRGDTQSSFSIASAMSCQPGGYFVAIVAVPAFAAAAAVFWIIDSTSSARTTAPGVPYDVKSWQTPKPWEPRQRALGKHVGCMLGYMGAFCGLVSALTMRGTPLQELASLFFSMLSLGMLSLAASLTVLCSDPSVPGYTIRMHFTYLFLIPLVVANVACSLSSSSSVDHDNAYSPWSVQALTEYLALLALALWPLTWAAEVHEERKRKDSGVFSWPTTPWRFD